MGRKKNSLDNKIKIKGISTFGPPVDPFYWAGSMPLTDSGQIIIPTCHIRYLSIHKLLAGKATTLITQLVPPFPRCPRSLSSTIFTRLERSLVTNKN